MIFRWSFWGDHKTANVELLSYSIRSFQKQFGGSHEYIVYSDDVVFLQKELAVRAEIRIFPTQDKGQYCFDSKPTWKKWCPKPRLDVTQDEFFIDSDVFLVKYPTEIDEILVDQQIKFAILDEYIGKSFQHGAMHTKASTLGTPFINAGFFLQKAHSDISPSLLREFEWWKENIDAEDYTHHDEQGCLAIALTDYLKRGELKILPKDKYMLISETSNPDVESLEDVTLFHATYPTHPAFYKFQDALDEILK